jgi:hypothetical protein
VLDRVGQLVQDLSLLLVELDGAVEQESQLGFHV